MLSEAVDADLTKSWAGSPAGLLGVMPGIRASLLVEMVAPTVVLGQVVLGRFYRAVPRHTVAVIERRAAVRVLLGGAALNLSVRAIGHCESGRARRWGAARASVTV